MKIFGRTVKIWTDEEMHEAIEKSLMEGALSAIRYYKNRSPKNIIGKMGVLIGSDGGTELNARILNMMIGAHIIALDGQGQLFIVE